MAEQRITPDDLRAKFDEINDVVTGEVDGQKRNAVAAAVIVGASVILFDPIFQGLAISLMAGEVASLLLSRMTVPILFYVSESRKHRSAI